MFPQYCGASTGAVFDQVSGALRRMRSVPALKFVSNYHDDPAYIEALAASVHEHRREFGITRHLLMSFHGVPERYVALGDPYRDHCQRTATLLAQRLGLAADAWSVSFQSRFGRARWLQPYTSEVLAGLPRLGVKSVSVICPASRPTASRLWKRSAWKTVTSFLRRVVSSTTTSRRSMRAPITLRRSARW
jgi:ferrochelatase